jgi:hypothetical protein
VIGVESAEVNPTTGSMLIYHDPVSVSRETLLALLRQEGYTKARNASPRHRRFALGAVASGSCGQSASARRGPDAVAGHTDRCSS